MTALADLWLDEVEPNNKCNLFGGDDSLGDGFISFLDRFSKIFSAQDF
jgi:hypothetical protein